MHNFTGSGIISVGSYDYDTKQLTLTFARGGTYDYADVPGHIWIGLTTAISAGQFFHKTIKPAYKATKRPEQANESLCSDLKQQDNNDLPSQRRSS